MHEQLLQLVLIAALDHVNLRVVPAEAGERAAFGGAFRLFEYRTFSPLIYLDNIASGIFIEDRDYVDDYRQLIPQLLSVSLDEGQSRELTAELADEYDRGTCGMPVSTTWRKSTYSDQSDCVEVGFWKKSTCSDQAGSDCVEVAFADTGAAVRDSKNTDGPVLPLPAPTWREFVAAIK